MFARYNIYKYRYRYKIVSWFRPGVFSAPIIFGEYEGGIEDMSGDGLCS